MKRLLAALAALQLAAVAVPAAAQASPTVTELTSGFTNMNQMHQLTAGPDGNLWATDNWNGFVDRITPGGTVTEFSTLGPISSTEGITTGPDGALWFTATASAKVGRITTAGTVTNSYTLGGSSPMSIVSGPDGALWFTESGSPAKIGRLTTSGTLTEFTLPTASSSPWDITSGPDGELWFTEHTNPGKVGKIDPTTHAITEYSVGSGLPYDIRSGPDGMMWFTLGANPGAIGRIATDGSSLQTWTTPTANVNPLGLVAGPDGNMYFTEKTGNGGVGRVSMSGAIQEFPGGAGLGLTANANPWGIATGPDGNIWFAEGASNRGIAKLSIEPVPQTQPASAVGARAGTLNATVSPSSQATSAYFQYGATIAYGAQTPTVSAGAGAAAVPLAAAIGSLAPNTTYHYRLVASNASGTSYGSDLTFTTASDPAGGASTTSGGGSNGQGQPNGGPGQPAGAAPRPVLAQTVVVSGADGRVLVRLPGSSQFTTLGQATSVPVGSVVDARAGTVELTSVRNQRGTLETGQFRGLFEVRQQRTGVTDLYLRGQLSGCGRAVRRTSAVASARRRVVVRRLWGRDRHGNFRTHGSRAVATVRGTEWSVTDSCSGTRTRVMRGAVAVRDLGTHRTVLVRAGRSYLARRRG